MTAAPRAAKPHRIFTTPVAEVYPLDLAKVQKKGRSCDELDSVLRWLTGFDDVALTRHLADGSSFAEFFAQTRLNPAAAKIIGVV